jgi:hypothetical protein
MAPRHMRPDADSDPARQSRMTAVALCSGLTHSCLRDGQCTYPNGCKLRTSLFDYVTFLLLYGIALG